LVEDQTALRLIITSAPQIINRIEPMNRADILAEAAKLTTGDRNASYGTPYDNLTHMAHMVSSYVCGKYGLPVELNAEDMAWIMVFAKVSRTVATYKDDNYIDAAAYAAIAGECREIAEGVDRSLDS
jgi:hypothetical protein